MSAVVSNDKPKFDPDWVIAPGETLAEWLEHTGVPESVAQLYGISPKVLAGVLRGTHKIGPSLAQKLCNLTLISAPFWLALEHNYRVGLAAGKKRIT